MEILIILILLPLFIINAWMKKAAARKIKEEKERKAFQDAIQQERAAENKNIDRRQEEPNAHWYYFNKTGEKVGPITVNALKSLAQKGVVSRETVIENINGRTAVAGSVRGLE